MKASKKISEYFLGGCTEKKRIGLELEHFVMKNGSPVNYSDGVREMVTEMTDGASRIYSENGNILGADMGEYTVTLEPGAQIEVSVCPFESTDKIKTVLEEFYKRAESALKPFGAELCTLPTINERQLAGVELIPKKRYEYMDRYFKNSGTMGHYMMRGSASTQVSVDYESEADFVAKYRAAYILSPFFAIICSNGTPEFKRLEIWDNVDGARTHIPPMLFSDTFGFEAYAKELLKVSGVFVPYGGNFVYTGGEPMGVLAEKYGCDESMIEHYLSMVFPDVRLKRYIEIRIADAMPPNRATEYAELIRRVFYTKALEDVAERYKNVTVADIQNAKRDIIKNGANAVVYGRSASDGINYLESLMR